MDTLTPEQRSERMSRVKGKDSSPEMLVRRLVHALGFRFRLHRRDLPGTPDLVFPGRKKVIFVHGCFWHRHPNPACKLARLPKSRQDFWIPKLDRNRARDEEAAERLASDGWRILTIWECEVRDTSSLRNRLRTFLAA